MKANFSSIFNELYRIHGKKLEKMRKTHLIKEILILNSSIIVLVICLILFKLGIYEIEPSVMLLLFFICLIFSSIYIMKGTKKYSQEYKEIAIRTLVNRL